MSYVKTTNHNGCKYAGSSDITPTIVNFNNLMFGSLKLNHQKTKIVVTAMMVDNSQTQQILLVC